MFGPDPKGPHEGGAVLVNNNKNKSLVPGGYMSDTIHKTEGRRFQEEERRDVMNMKKMFAGLIALVAGVALSAGSAFATKGYMSGDPAMMKLVPYYETGDNRATLIAIQNLSPQESATMDAHSAVEKAQMALDGDNGADRNVTARYEANLAAAMDDLYTEHVFVNVNVFNDTGMMMGSASLCLAEHQFGYVILQGPAMQDWQTEIPNRGMILSYMDGEIPASGYVQVMAEDRKFVGCGVDAPNRLMTVATPFTASADDDADARDPADSQVGTWAIIQDTGDGFFGTEVPTATISMASSQSVRPNADGEYGTGVGSLATGATLINLDAELACYSGNLSATGGEDTTALNPAFTAAGTGTPASITPGQLPHSEGMFMQSRCGLIPERHYLLMDPDGTLDVAGEVDTPGDSSSENGHAFVRYDAGDETAMYVWLAKGMDPPGVTPSLKRMLHAQVKCEDGMVVRDMDANGTPKDIAIPAPTMITKIDPNSDVLGDFTSMCEGDRGTLRITMPTGSHAGMAFSHISQRMDSFRMNFQGYNMASNMEMDETGTSN